MEHILPLLDGRQLAYAEAGDPLSDTVVLNIHGLFTYGQIDTKNLAPVFSQKSLHLIWPTQPGWGRSTPAPAKVPYRTFLCGDMTALLNHTRPVPPKYIYIVGGSYGTLGAQILYGAPYDQFPYGKHIAGLMILGPFSPFNQHKDYAKTFTLSSYLSIGPAAPYVPFLSTLSRIAVSSKLKNVESAQAFLSNMFHSKMGDGDKEEFLEWRARKGGEEGQFEREMAEKMVKSVEFSWEGFKNTATHLHEDWGFKVGGLDDEHTKAPVLIVCADKDDMSPPEMARWLDAHYKNSTVKVLSGGHLAAVTRMDQLWEEFLKPVPTKYV